MKKETTLSHEFNSIMKNISQKKEESIKDLEELKEKIVLKINIHIDKLYQKRNEILKVFADRKELRKYRKSVANNFIRKNILNTIKFILSMPFIYMMIIPGILIHIGVEIYQQVCFRIYKIPLVKPKDFFIFDRHKLPHLNWVEKIHCFYCAYYNCLISYLQEIVGRTERFWCPIKHARRIANTHKYYEQFVDYSNAKNLRKIKKELRKFKEIK